jgi:hypothetical protein
MMTRTRKIYEFITGINFKSIVPKVLNIAIFFVCTYLFLNVMNTYAATAEEFMNVKIDKQLSYRANVDENIKSTGDSASNVDMSGNLSAFNGGFIGLAILRGSDAFTTAEVPGVDSTFDKVSQGGLLGIADEGVLALYRNQPNVNVPEHMAKQWVPGYDQSVRSTVAAEDGYELLSSIGIDDLWEKTRLIAYVLFVIILMAAGFMIMFRQKIGGQVMITVFNTLPGVIVGLIVVTFSFAIVGLVLNLGMILVNVIGNLLDPSGQSLISVNGPFGLMNLKNIGGFLTSWGPEQGFTMTGGGLVALFTGVGALLFAGVTIGPAIGVAALAFFIVVILIGVIVLWASVKVYITVLTAYIGIILDTVLAPFYLVAAALPGQSTVGTDWFKRILRHTLTFPLVFFFINLGGYIIKSDVDFSFPGGLVGSATSGADALMNDGVGYFIKAVLTLILFFVAAESPKFLLDILPTNGGKGAEAVIGGTKASLSKIPLIGGFFG